MFIHGITDDSLFDQNLIPLINSYIPDYELLSWIDINKISWSWLSGNPNAIHLLEANPRRIDWSWLSGNPNAIHLLEANPNKIDWVIILMQFIY